MGKMPTEQEQDRMLEYIVENLRATMLFVEPRKRNIVSSIDTNIVEVGKYGAVLLVDQPYPKRKNKKKINPIAPLIYYLNKNGRPRVAVVFYKDGETFFVSEASRNPGMREWNRFQDFRKGGVKYSEVGGLDPIQRMIHLSEEEREIVKRDFFYNGLGHNGNIQYYQPESAKLKEMIVTFSFETVRLNYQGYETKAQRISGYIPNSQPSEKLKIWKKKTERIGPIVMNGEYLVKP